MNKESLKSPMDTNGEVQTKSVHFVSLGCPKNLVDSEMMVGQMMQANYQVVQDPQQAETIVVNTCGFIESAKEESISTILQMAELKEKGALKKLVVTGCLAQRYKNELADQLPEADIMIGTGEFHKIVELLKEDADEDTHETGIQVETDKPKKSQKRHFHLPTYLQEDHVPRVNSGPFYRAYIKISEGCKKRCAFCAIPLIRGNLQSRRLPSLVAEAKLLVASGVRELIVISHDFTDYGWDLRRKDETAEESPYEVLRALSDVKGLDWVRVLYLYPDGVTPELIQLMKSRNNLVKYFDMPLQHINNEMLKKMNRKMTREKIVDVLNLIRREIPEAVIRTQFIVGFPGETEEQFEELLGFIQEQKFDRVGCFKYSPEENTAGFKMTDQVEEDVKEDRYHRLMKIQMKISRAKHRAFIGKTIPVLIEGVSEESELLLKGRMSQQAPDIDGMVYINSGTANIGEIVPVLITHHHDYDLVGEIVESHQKVDMSSQGLLA